jgi:serine phosphatase RsbU (regulator of sigma subunit)
MAKDPLKVLFLGNYEQDFRFMREYLHKMKRIKSVIQWISDCAEGSKRLLTYHFDVCFVDAGLGQRKSLELLREAMHAGCSAPIIMLSNKRHHSFDVKAMKAGAADYLIKSEIDTSFLERSIRYSITQKKKELALSKSKRLQQTAKEKLEKIVRSINEEMETAQKVQESMIPRQISEMSGLSLATAFLPCGRIGGDLYDVIKIDETKTCFLMFDVVGHGVPAALISSMVTVSFNKNITSLASTSEIMERVNREIINIFKEKRHITAFIAIYNSKTREIVFTGGGHPAPIVLRSNSRRLEYLSSRGLPLGMFTDIKYEVSKMQLMVGDCIVFYTDGLTECHNNEGALLGKKQLEGILAGMPEQRSPEDVLGAILRAQLSFSGEAARSDDITIVVVKIS